MSTKTVSNVGQMFYGLGLFFFSQGSVQEAWQAHQKLKSVLMSELWMRRQRRYSEILTEV